MNEHITKSKQDALDVINDSIVAIMNESDLIYVRSDKSKFPHIAKIDSSSAKNWLFRQMQLLSLRMTLGWELLKTTAMANDVYNEIMRSTEAKSLTLSELSYAFERGCAGGYGANFRIDCSCIIGWIKSSIDEHRDTYLKIMKAEADEEKRKRWSQKGSLYLEKCRADAQRVRYERLMNECASDMCANK